MKPESPRLPDNVHIETPKSSKQWKTKAIEIMQETTFSLQEISTAHKWYRRPSAVGQTKSIITKVTPAEKPQ